MALIFPVTEGVGLNTIFGFKTRLYTVFMRLNVIPTWKSKIYFSFRSPNFGS